MEKFELKIGDRVDVNGEIATIKFLGSVPPFEGEWVGVEWDNEKRGKHNGSKNGIQYFTCKSQTGGSFVRRHKINYGVTFEEAFINNYCDDETIECRIDKTKRLNYLKVVSLDKKLVYSVGDITKVSKMISGVAELYLSGNLFTSCDHIEDIITQLPGLQTISLSENYFKWDEIADDKASLKPQLRTVLLNSCNLNWNKFIKSCCYWGKLSALSLRYNNINQIDCLHECLLNISHLELSGNPINDWNNLKILNQLPRLQTLQVNDCGFSEVNIEDGDFKFLKSIFISENKFEKLSVLNGLNKLENLEEVLCLNNPLNKKHDSLTLIEMMIAKISRLQKANNQTVSEKLRADSELGYLKFFGADWRNCGGHQNPKQNKPSKDFLTQHPQYMNLIEKYGAPEDNEVFKQTTALKANLIEVQIADATNPDFKTVTRKLPKSMKISSVKQMVFRLTKKANIDDCNLVYISKNVSLKTSKFF